MTNLIRNHYHFTQIVRSIRTRIHTYQVISNLPLYILHVNFTL